MIARAKTAGCLLAATLASTSLAQDLAAAFGKVPECGLDCILKLVPESACRTFTNVSCICSDPDFFKASQHCVLTTCEDPLDALVTARIDSETCQRPIRDRRDDLPPLVAITALGVLAPLIRFYGRLKTVGRFELDDWIMLVCEILYIPYACIGLFTAYLAFGRDVWIVDTNDLILGLKLFYTAESFYIVTLALTKISILFFYLRIFPNRWMRSSIYTLMAINILSSVIFLFMEIFQCTPVKFNWEGWKGNFGSYHCVDVNKLVVAATGFCVGLDAAILLLPLPLLFRLNMSWRTKAGVIFMFSLGAFILGTACVRLHYTLQYARSSNPTWDHLDVLIWSGLETAVSMIVTSLPAIRSLFKASFPDLFSIVLSKSGWSSHSDSNRRRNKPGDDTEQSATSRMHHGAGTGQPVESYQFTDIENHSQAQLTPGGPELGDKSSSAQNPAWHHGSIILHKTTTINSHEDRACAYSEAERVQKKQHPWHDD